MIDLERCKTEIEYRLISRYMLLENFKLFVLCFFKWTYGKDFIWGSHHSKIVDFLEKIHRGEITYAIVNMPPRYGKTELIIKLFSAWCIAKNPSCVFMHLSYSDPLAMDNSDTVREIVKSDAYLVLFPKIGIKKHKDSKSAWATTDNGVFYAAASGGVLTGFGAGAIDETDEDGKFQFSGAILIDDPLKPDDAHSDARRTSINKRWDETIKNRRNGSKTPVIVVMQRLHEDDFCATLLNDEEFEWNHLCLPALNDKDEALWPTKHTAIELKAMKKKNGYVFSGQYQQTPTPAGGGLFKDKWWRYYSKLPPKVDYLFITGDTALKAKKQNDFSVFMCWAVAEKKLYLLDMIRGKWEAPELEMQYYAFWNKWKDHKPKPRCAYIEDKASGTGLIQRIQRKAHSPVRPIQRNIDKVTRAHDTTPYVESGYVLLPMIPPQWMSDYMDEVSKFTAEMTHKHDDICDNLFDAVQIAFGDSSLSMWDVM